MPVEVIETSSLGDRSYLMHEGKVGLVIDPQRDIDRVLAVGERVGMKIVCVAETHVHNDYVTGGLVLSRVTGARYIHAAEESLHFDYEQVVAGDWFWVGRLAVDVVHTPGHTPHHLSYVVRPPDGPPAVFTAGSLLKRTVGRTDLISEARTEDLARAQFRSSHRLAADLADETLVFPTHGFGSFCGSRALDVDTDGTLGSEREVNLVFVARSEEGFVDQLVGSLDDYPRYYAHLGPLNSAGPLLADLSPPAPVDPVGLRRRIHAGEWVVDLRNRRVFASEHLAGTIGIELADSFSTYLGWLIPWGTPLTLLGDDLEDVAEAQRHLVRIGLDRPAAASTGGIDVWADRDAERRSYPVVEFEQVADARRNGRDISVVDLRRRSEWDDSHIEGALHMPLHHLLNRMHELPDNELWVHCASGFRSSIAASLLDRAGRRVVLIDDDYSGAAEAGRQVVGPGE